jgi:hypothetical protein
VVPRRSRDGRATLWLVIVLIVVLAAGLAYWATFRRVEPVETGAAGPARTLPAAADLSFLPNPARTPGATLPVTPADLCVPGYSRKVRHVPEEVKQSAYRAYGIAQHAPGEYEVDHLVSLELGGSNAVRNLWPQSYYTEPWNAHVKDQLENELHRRVCDGELDLATAQRDIAGNWIEAYRHYFHTGQPLAGRERR